MVTNNTYKPVENNIAEICDFDKTTPLFPIGTVATSLNVHQRTLRIYDEQGILVPARTKTDRRCYSQNDLQKGMLIQYLTRELGFNLAGIKFTLKMLELQNLSGHNAINFFKEIAKDLYITPEMQADNKIKFSKRGRRTSIENKL